MENFGDYLKAQREAKGIRLEELASITKISPHSLRYLEANRWDKLPPHPFLRGFVVAYAKYVGIDETECLNRYHQAVVGGGLETNAEGEGMLPPSVKVSASPPAHAGRTANQVISESTGLPFGKLAFGGVAALVLVGAFSLIYLGKAGSQPQAQMAANTAIEAPVEPSSAEPPVVAASEAPDPGATQTESPLKVPLAEGSNRQTAATSDHPHRLIIKGLEKTWMKVVVDESKPLEYFLGEDKTAGYKAKEKIKLVIGDVRNVEIFHNDAKVEPHFRRGNVATYIYPTGASFPQDARKKPEDGEEEKEE